MASTEAYNVKMRPIMKNDPDYAQLCSDVAELRPSDLVQPTNDFIELYGDAGLTQAKLAEFLATGWQADKNPKLSFLQHPVPGTALPWIEDADNPGVKGKERARFVCSILVKFA